MTAGRAGCWSSLDRQLDTLTGWDVLTPGAFGPGGIPADPDPAWSDLADLLGGGKHGGSQRKSRTWPSLLAAAHTLSYYAYGFEP